MQPLGPFRIVDITQNVAGPFCTQVLADLGADVIKVEPVDGGDSTRQWGPPFWEGEAAMFLAFNRNKRSIAIDLKAPEGRMVLERLLATADVFVHSLRPAAARRLRLDAESLNGRHKKLIVCEVSAFGTSGPLRDDPGYDPLLQAFSGLMSVTGQPDAHPVRVGTSIVDMGTGLWAALGIVVALLDRARAGVGRVVRTSLFEVAMAWLPYQIAGYLATGQPPRRWGTELSMLAPYGAFKTANGSLVIAAGNDSIWRRLCIAIGQPELADDERFRTNPDRVRHRDDLRKALESGLHAATAQEWEQRLRVAGVPASVVNTVAEAIRHPQAEAMQILQPFQHPQIADLRLVRMPLTFHEEESEGDEGPPLHGEDTEDILRGSGFREEEIVALVNAGVVQTTKVE